MHFILSLLHKDHAHDLQLLDMLVTRVVIDKVEGFETFRVKGFRV